MIGLILCSLFGLASAGLFYIVGYGICALLIRLGGWESAPKEYRSFLEGEDFSTI